MPKMAKILNTMLSDKRKEVILKRYSIEQNPSKKVPSLADIRRQLKISESAISFREREAFNNILMFLKKMKLHLSLLQMQLTKLLLVHITKG
jgi:DNA-directed RNA polymerase specialized sigma subunit